MMTEPDLVSIGDFCSVDEASLVAHINTRGVFRYELDGMFCMLPGITFFKIYFCF
jgi:hypothetical protein